MSVIAKSELVKLIRAGAIKIEPFDESQIGPGSIDIHVGNTFIIYNNVHELVHVTDDSDFKKITRKIQVDDYYLLLPHESVLAVTLEKITLPDNICGRLEGRSRFARLGLFVHIAASFMHPGISNHQILEMYNASPLPLAIHPGTRICQFIFERTEGTGHYAGQFQDQ